MSDIITNAGAAGTDGAAVGTSPAQPAPEVRVDRAAAVMFGKDPAPAQPAAPAPAPAPAPTPTVPAQGQEPSLAEVIRVSREARQKHQQETQRASTLEQELTKVRQELAQARASAAFEDDPVGYAKAKQWSKEQQLLFGQSLLYDLAPDKADPDFRYKMFEDRQKREKAEAARAQEEAQRVAQAQAVQDQMHEFYGDVAAAARTFTAGSYPETEAWFGDDFGAYMTSLMATAQNVSAAAQAQNRVADLSPAALASALEAETARRMSARDQRKQQRAPKQTPAQPAEGVQPLETMSTKNMNGSGTPAPPAASDKERIARAAQVVFKTR